MSPILVRPVREQLEHDRVIRQLQARWRRRYNVAANLGAEQTASAGTGTATLYPDLVLTSLHGGRKIHGIVEVETGESVNNMEALAQWGPMARFRAPFYLYVPSGSVEAARRLCSDNQIEVTEIWGYHSLGDQTRFALVHRGARQPSAAATRQGSGRPEPRSKGAEARARRSAAAGRGSQRRAAPRRGSGRSQPGSKAAPKKARPGAGRRARTTQSKKAGGTPRRR
ncbi:MAG: hypothetical protein HYZ58_00790 [Acidobacteria bacterium]|nr:hypothetical protein [Acidobacteriota bacterium]